MKVFMYVFPFILVSCASMPDQRRELASESIQFHDAVTRTITRPINSEVIPDSSDSFSNGLVQILGQLGSEMGVVQSEIKLVEAASDQMKSLKLKRAFLYIQPEGNSRSNNWYARIFKGQKNAEFGFLRKVEIKVSDVEILTYDQKTMKRDVNENGMIYIAGSKDAAKTKKILKSDPQLNEIIEKLVVVDDLVFIHLKADAVEEHFVEFITQNGELLEKSGLTTIDVCSQKNCIELDAADVNLAPLLVKEGLVLDSTVKTSKIPEASKIKGYIELEVKIETGF